MHFFFIKKKREETVSKLWFFASRPQHTSFQRVSESSQVVHSATELVQSDLSSFLFVPYQPSHIGGVSLNVVHVICWDPHEWLHGWAPNLSQRHRERHHPPHALLHLHPLQSCADERITGRVWSGSSEGTLSWTTIWSRRLQFTRHGFHQLQGREVKERWSSQDTVGELKASHIKHGQI